MLKNLRLVFQTGLEAAQKELAAAIESGDATGSSRSKQKNCNFAFENAKLDQAKAVEKKKCKKQPAQTFEQRPVQQPNG